VGREADVKKEGKKPSKVMEDRADDAAVRVEGWG
jgi:hypothetical protein